MPFDAGVTSGALDLMDLEALQEAYAQMSQAAGRNQVHPDAPPGASLEDQRQILALMRQKIADRVGGGSSAAPPASAAPAQPAPQPPATPQFAPPPPAPQPPPQSPAPSGGQASATAAPPPPGPPAPQPGPLQLPSPSPHAVPGMGVNAPPVPWMAQAPRQGLPTPPPPSPPQPPGAPPPAGGGGPAQPGGSGRGRSPRGRHHGVPQYTGAPEVDAVIAGVKRMVEGAGEVFSGLGDAVKSERAGGIAKGAGQSLEGLGKATGMFGETTIGSVGKFISFVGEGADKLQDFVKGLHDSNVKFAEFSGGMAQVQANQTMRDMELSRQRGDNRAESAEGLAQSMHKMNVQFARVEDAWANVKNDWGAKLADTAEKILKFLNDALGLKEINDKGGRGETMAEALEAINVMTRAGLGEGFGRPPQFNP